MSCTTSSGRRFAKAATGACLRIANSSGSDRAPAFAELCVALCLAGELSLSATIASGEFVKAHRRRARGPAG
jgi:hydroxymethylglutaryl-CoA reductase (NADPH)